MASATIQIIDAGPVVRQRGRKLLGEGDRREPLGLALLCGIGRRLEHGLEDFRINGGFLHTDLR
jgi:hypothetical protein